MMVMMMKTKQSTMVVMMMMMIEPTSNQMHMLHTVVFAVVFLHCKLSMLLVTHKRRHCKIQNLAVILHIQTLLHRENTSNWSNCRPRNRGTATPPKPKDWARQKAAKTTKQQSEYRYKR